MVNSTLIHEIVRSAVNAPSGHNFQPWKFKIDGDVLHTFNDPHGDETILNFNQNGSLLAHGALIENIATLSRAFGLASTVVLLPNESDPTHTASITFAEGNAPSPQETQRASSVATRSTNRKPYTVASFSNNERHELSAVPAEYQSRVLLLEDRPTIERVARSLSVSDWLVFNARVMHEFLFNHLVWSKRDEEVKKAGLFLDTLELPPPVKAMFSVLKFWPVARFLGALGFGSFVATDNAKGYQAVSALGAVEAHSMEPRDVLNAGRAMQHLWLTAETMGISIQPIMGALFLSLRIEHEGNTFFSNQQAERIAAAGVEIRNAFGASDKPLVYVFRIGRGRRPSARSSRRAPVILHA